MKFYYTILLLVFSITVSYSQEFIKHATIHFKDSTEAKGDFYYYTTLPETATLMDTLEKKQVYKLSTIAYIEGMADLYRVMDFNGTPLLVESLVEGKEVSLYKTDINDELQLYIFKDGKIQWLQGGKMEYENDGRLYSKNNEKYKGALKFLLSDNDYVVKKIAEAKYTEADIVPLIIAYNYGHISYVKTKAMEKQHRIPDNKLYIQYSTGYYVPMYMDVSTSTYFQLGKEFIATEGSRQSFKVGIEYGKFKGIDLYPDANWLVISSGYYYDFLRFPTTNLYVGIRIVDIGALWDQEDSKVYLLPRLSPLFGIEQQVTNNLALYVELNHLLRGGGYGRNLTFGVSYDLK